MHRLFRSRSRVFRSLLMLAVLAWAAFGVEALASARAVPMSRNG